MGDSPEQVGLDISLRFIFKPSYSPHCININVSGHSFWTDDVTKKEFRALL
jgi:hypothetical protein